MDKTGFKHTKTCFACKKDLPVTSFCKDTSREDGLYYRCRQCTSESRAGKRRLFTLKYNYGLSLEDWDKMFQEQNGVCAICNQPSDETLHVDHDHKTGKVRGLLCYNCNHGIGKLKDDVSLLENAIKYLRKNNNNV